MPEETKPGTPPSPGENQAAQRRPLQCSEFEALLTDALEAKLDTAGKEQFEAHRRACAVCGPMFAEVEAGRLWLQSLQPVEPPANLVDNILAATTGVARTRIASAPSGATTTPLGERLREWWDSWTAPVFAFVRQPRFSMSFGMIFFMGSLGMSLAGVKPSDVSKVDLRPSALRHAYNDAQIKVVQYYDNIRFVYEIESKVRELKRATTPAEPAPAEKKQNRDNNNTSGQPDLKQDRNYSEQQSDELLANLRTESNGAASHELRTAGAQPAASEVSLARSSKLMARSYAVLEARHVPPPVTLTTTNRRFV